MACYKEELFGPVLVCLSVDTLEKAVQLLNANEYGNGVSIFTESGSSAAYFQKNVEAGQVGINVVILVRLPMFSFTGNKKIIAGWHFTRRKRQSQAFDAEKILTLEIRLSCRLICKSTYYKRITLTKTEDLSNSYIILERHTLADVTPKFYVESKPDELLCQPLYTVSMSCPAFDLGGVPEPQPTRQLKECGVRATSHNTVFPANYTDWPNLNPCLLNVCCDVWGQCGITSDFCTPSSSVTGAPGTAAPGSNGCISNCGTEIVASQPPAKFALMGYYENFNNESTPVHSAFANITSDYDVRIEGGTDVFQEFTVTEGFDRIVSFRGWTFSTDPSTFPIF
ncbi:aldehyde dehydrogenase, putative [Talaromyces stipitatus ATCC 10500]|uniref:Aldehyde dehydrogenase, putative n=1 Tax=Talaromyces stipitatus (strain ATCC 10500 / CBS 375.48 / QM 6759 / NRRL 1006) TaxID=441959 RepID=B8MDG8_TALSN|nr:aldehyde dehydrogenase, putative [Talaromyces stipitatus ATCC 10500]EED17931.1 aldehyde dehydrogenase, putative [Talaromyces stipitatus ATCC 10500]